MKEINLEEFVILIDGKQKDIYKICEVDNGQYFLVYFSEDTKPYKYSRKKISIKSKCEIKPQTCLLTEMNDYYNQESQMNDIYKYRNKRIRSEMEKRSCNDPEKFFARQLENKKYRDANNILFPFGVNESQFEAVKNALENKYSVIQGPPGTGKTQTILNIIANLVMEGKTICITSSNNTAVDNVLEKLKKNELDHIMANIGSLEKTTDFFKGRGCDCSNNLNNNRDRKKHLKLAKGFLNLQNNLNLENQIAELKNDLHETEQECRHILKKVTGEVSEVSSITSMMSSKVLVRYIALLENIYFKYLKKQHDYNDLLALYIRYYKKYILETEKKITKLENRFNREKLTELVEHSLDYFKTCSNVHALKSSEITEDNYRTRFSEFIREYPVIGSTSASLYSTKGNNFKFDYLIIDEASQMNLYEGVSAITCAKNIVVVGDDMQLQPVVINEKIHQFSGINTKTGFLSAFTSQIVNVKTTMLKEHYRCDRSIINFNNIFFYNNELKIHTSYNGKTMDMIECENSEEVKKVELDLFHQDKDLISPYRGKLADTIYSYQGREADHIYLCIEKDFLTQFTRSKNLVNVAVSRSKNKFTIVSKDFSADNSIVGDLFKYIKYYTYNDLEYNPNTLFVKLHKAKKVGRYSPSEKIIKDVLEEIKREFPSVDYLYEYKLSSFVDSRLGCNQEQIDFIQSSSHIDFLIYNRANKLPWLAIEVDGYTFHLSEEAKYRDRLKNEICEMNNLPILRLNTKYETNERNRILNTLKLNISNENYTSEVK